MRHNKKVTTVLVNLYAVAGVVLVLFPMYLTIVTAFKTPEESARNFFALPSSLYLGNFAEVIKRSNYLMYVFNSFFITVVSVAVIAIFTPMVSYSIARNMQHSKYYSFLYYYLVIGIFIPFQVIMIPLVKQVTTLGLLSKYGLIILYISFSLMQAVFLFVGYIKSVPIDVEESAFIDGCNVWQVFIKIVYPLIKPMTATVIIVNSLWIWNDFLLPLLILNKTKNNWTLPLFQFNFKSQYTFDYNLAFASFLLAMLPIVILYAFLQKYIVDGLTSGAVKA